MGGWGGRTEVGKGVGQQDPGGEVEAAKLIRDAREHGGYDGCVHEGQEESHADASSPGGLAFLPDLSSHMYAPAPLNE